MTHNYSTLTLGVALHAALLSGTALAAATADEIAELGKSRTCVGALKAGNAAGTIPPWSGKWLGAPEHVNFQGTGNHPVDPYPDDQPLFVITAQNMAQYVGQLSAGQKALFTKYQQSFQMPIYESRRDFRFPDSVCEATRKNAQSAKQVDDGEGVEATTGGILFPFPRNGLELLWTSSIFTYRPWTEELISDNAYVLDNGNINWGRVKSRNLAPHLKPGTQAATEGQSSYYLNETLLPERDRGEINTGMEFWNHSREPRQSWRYDPGTRRVRQSPEYGYDMSFPGTGGSITVDEVRIFNGSPKRYNWEIVGQQEMYIPYNSYRLHSSDISYDDLLTPGHANPKHMRYELHRVWVLEGNLKQDYRHIYGKRRMYIDEDTWFMVMADNYDARGGLWRTSMLNYFYAYEAQTWQAGVGFYHDLQAGSYLAFNLINEQPKGYMLNRGTLNDRDFGPQAARRAGL
ncbi:DUF1329 domain-containing protein [Marinobacterium sedimentorum]|uniref:DUF1329 domain-containing protein n=1 Tax=Marinobacterium sedimentorum TaxID=2927804 RepID=UPI0020C60C0E|nr:DUF1329 domain-containing protein [Marinobacterium sedimentorum]MCP8689996.1 DUF1329 domain-containing protein [Marinobacterium sedimentorum]